MIDPEIQCRTTRAHVIIPYNGRIMIYEGYSRRRYIGSFTREGAMSFLCNVAEEERLRLEKQQTRTTGNNDLLKSLGL